jgi:hypothetical protein
LKYVVWKKIWFFSATLVFTSCLLCGLSFAGFYTQGGLLDIPVAYTIENTQVDVGVSSYLIVKQPPNVDVPGKQFREMDAWFTVGLINRVEVGMRYYGPKTFSGFVKAKILNETSHIPAISIGMLNISPNTKVNSWGANASDYYHNLNYSFFIVASKDMHSVLRLPLKFHLGVGSGSFIGAWKHSFPWQGIFGGIEWNVNKIVDIIGELDGRDFNAGVRFSLPYNFTITAGIGEIEQWWWGGPDPSDPNRPSVPVYDEYDEPKFSLSVQYLIGPLISGAEQERLMRLKNRIERALERLKQARDRRQASEQELERLRDILIK